MLTGEEFDADQGRAVEQYQITTIDHGFNASTFTARVICSSGADVAAAVVGGMGALSGPLHGGAPVAGPRPARRHRHGRQRPAVPGRRTSPSGEKIMGFGHRVYKTDDPRSTFLRGVAERIDADKVEFAKVVEQTVVEVLAELKPGRDLYANVEFYAGVVMDHCGLPARSCSPPRSRRAASSAGAPTSSSRPPTTGSSGRRPSTSARRRPSRCPTPADRPGVPGTKGPGGARRDRCTLHRGAIAWKAAEMHKVLVGMDRSSGGMAALAWAGVLAHQVHAELVVAHVYAADQTDTSSWDVAHDRMRDRLDEWCTHVRALPVTVETALLDGEVGPALLAAAHEREVDLLVVSRRAEEGLDAVLMGSAADHVAHHARCPIAIVPPATQGIAPHHLLLGLDASPEARAVARWCAPLASALGARVTAVFVTPDPDLGPESHTGGHERTRASLDLGAAPVRELGVAVDARIVVDRHPADALLETAATVGADLVVVGTRAIGGLRRIRLGGVTMQLLHHADRPVIAVPPPA